MPDPVTDSQQQERCTCGTNAEGNPTECPVHGPELFESHAAQPVEQEGRAEAWVICPVCDHAEKDPIGRNPVRCAGFQTRGTAHDPTFMRRVIPASSLTTANQQIEELTEQLRKCHLMHDAEAYVPANQYQREKVRADSAQAEVEELTRERDRTEEARAAYERERDWLDERLTAAEAQRDTLREGMDGVMADLERRSGEMWNAYSGTSATLRARSQGITEAADRLRSVLSTPPDKGEG